MAVKVLDSHWAMTEDITAFPQTGIVVLEDDVHVEQIVVSTEPLTLKHVSKEEQSLTTSVMWRITLKSAKTAH